MKTRLTRILAFAVAVMMFLTAASMSLISAQGINPFTDVSADAYYYDAVLWAYANGITTGTTATKFAPADTCTRGQVVTFLWRAAGKPEPETKENRFTDVKDSDYYYKPILWAVENGITNGTSEKMFSPLTTCTNAHIITFIWRALGEEGKTETGEWYTDAVNWAQSSGLLDGTTDLDVNSDGYIKGGCPRANVVEYLYRYDKTSSTVAKIYVSPMGNDKDADGSLGRPFATIDAARAYVRTMDKTGYTGITVKIAKGEYSISKAISFTKEDSGTKECPITYEGADGASVIGGIKLTAKDFVRAEEGLTEYFPAEARGSIMSADLKPFGISDTYMQETMKGWRYLCDIPFLSANGSRQQLAQYPNDWLHIKGAEVFDAQWRPTDTDAGGDAHARYYRIDYGEEYAEAVQSWSEVLPVFVRARIYKLWCPDDSMVYDIHKDSPIVDIHFTGGHEPAPGTIMYFYNVPEALDIPGEYIIDQNAVLYYYPTETFESDVLSIPASEGFARIDGADYITFSNISFITCLGDGFKVNGDHITFSHCNIAGVQDQGIEIKGDGNRIESCVIHDAGADGITFSSGDIENIKGEGFTVYDCDIYDCSITSANGYCITGTGVNILISHNDCHDSNFKGIHIHTAVNATVEYNDVYRISFLSDDTGAMSGDGQQNANVVFRYNYVHEIGPAGEAAKILDYNPDYKYMGAYAFYFDNGCSYMEVCNNVVDGCDTGYLSNGGRHNSCHNNLFADCHDWYVNFSHFMYAGRLNDDGSLDEAGESYDSYVYNDAWKKANPDLAALKTTTVGTDPLDPMLWCAPAFNICRDNFIYYNKAERHFSNWGISPYNIEKYAELFSEGIEVSGKNSDPGLIEAYSSARAHKTIEEVVAEHSDILGMTLEQFRSIGRISD